MYPSPRCSTYCTCVLEVYNFVPRHDSRLASLRYLELPTTLAPQVALQDGWTAHVQAFDRLMFRHRVVISLESKTEDLLWQPKTSAIRHYEPLRRATKYLFQSGPIDLSPRYKFSIMGLLSTFLYSLFAGFILLMSYLQFLRCDLLTI